MLLLLLLLLDNRLFGCCDFILSLRAQYHRVLSQMYLSDDGPIVRVRSKIVVRVRLRDNVCQE